MSEAPARLRVVYMGTPEFAVPALEALVAHPACVVELVVSQPDRPSGRGQKLLPPPVAACAQAHGLPCFQPASLRTQEAVERLRDLRADLFVVAAYGQILSQEVLDLPRLGCVNLHASLLPRWRGAAPIHWAVSSGDAVTGVSLMQMEAGLDTGPVHAMRALMIGAEETTGELLGRLAALSAELLIEELPRLAAADRVPTPQSADRSCYARMLSADDRRLDFHQPAAAIAWRINGMAPWPGSRIRIEDQELSLLRARISPLDVPSDARPGTVLIASAERGLHLVGGDRKAVEILELKRPGKRTVTAREALLGMTLGEGALVEEPS